ncbi:pilus assembly protein CpaD [Aureimonas sp. SA4125]|uniref:CpaD family pilus assembly protein n=1 Tax=Aureimonas sp. SA4125 TaxID=2826993 RepID=UPI001CC57E90|nr:CpaD family pilus assembly protein [Aureimonas sp. SA4125]BDA82651.1 pilus assembly protein CpaD [Aureimonas sp. SA4125]
MSSLSRRAPAPRAGRRAALALVASLAILGGCADRHSIEVGSIPDDYRTRHPIVVGEDEEVLEIPVVSSEVRLPPASRDRVTTFAQRFRRSGSAAIRVLLPSGSDNSAAAELASRDVVKALHKEGIRSDRILVQPYRARGSRGPAPIRLSFATLTAKTAPCGRWPEDLGDTHENKNYFNFGCASQQNLAAQIADPRDLLGPRGIDPIDAERRTTMLGDYREGNRTSSQAPVTESTYDW